MDSREEDIAWLQSSFRPIPKPALPDDCLEYSLYIIDTKLDQSNASEVRLQLRDVQKYASDLQKQWLKDYIWQRQPFTLELAKENGLNLLRGRTEYGDSIEDEWVVVWLLRELTKKFPALWVKVTDTDGDFLLIEASGTIPAWLEPEVAENRVWINDGQLKIIKPAGTKPAKRTEEKLSLQEAHRVITSESKRVMHSVTIESEAFFRLRDYPGKINENMHHALVCIPRKLAYLLLQKASYVSPAIEAFYLRDPISIKPLQAKDASDKLTFSPQDIVELKVKFPRVAYAQLKSQEFLTPKGWRAAMPSPLDREKYSRAETGMKLACGFEILLSDLQYQDHPATREMSLLLEDLESGDSTLPTDKDLAKLDKRADDEKWLDINFEDLQSELNRSKTTSADLGTDTRSSEKAKTPSFGDKSTQENLQRIVQQFESFLNDDKTDNNGNLFGDEDGSDTDTDEPNDIDSDNLEEDEDKETSFDEDEFTKLMQEMMGMPPEVMKELMSGKIDALENGAKPNAPLAPASTSVENVEEVEADELSSTDEEEEYDGAEMQEIIRRMDAELEASRASDVDADAPAGGANMKATKGKNFEDTFRELDSDDDNIDDIDEDDPQYQANEQFAKNILESMHSQGGGAGPTSTLMALMAEQAAAAEMGKRKDKGKGKARSKARAPSARGHEMESI